MHLFVVIGMQTRAKLNMVTQMAEVLTARGASFTLLDNSDKPLELPDVPRVRLSGGCVCCSLAGAFIPAVWKLKTDYALLPVSSLADPETLAFVLDSLRGTIQITVIALVDSATQAQHPHLAQKYTFYSDY